MVRIQTLHNLLFVFLFFPVFHYAIVHAIRHQIQTYKNSIFSLPLRRHTSRAITNLARDQTRVGYINYRLQKALSGTSSHPNDFTEEEIQTSISSLGGSYAARLGVGQPVNEFNLIVDTASEITWLQCSPCIGCDGPFYDFLSSHTYRPLSCSSETCDALLHAKKCSSSNDYSDGTCNYEVSYGDNSKIIGVLGTDMLSFGSSGSVQDAGIGCGMVIGRNTLTGGLSGILGLGPSPISFPSQIQATSFSYCLVKPGSSSSSTLDFNSAAPGDSVNVKLVRNPQSDLFYYVELSGITVGKDQVQIPPSVYQIDSNGNGGIIIDSGATMTLLDSDVYRSLNEAFQRNAQNLAGSQVSVGGFGSCYEFSGSASAMEGPPMSLEFSGGQTVPLGQVNYFTKVSNSTFCLAFQPTDQAASIIGSTVQYGMRVTYDLGNSLIGFSPNKC